MHLVFQLNLQAQATPAVQPSPQASGGGGRYEDSLRCKRRRELEARRRETRRLLEDVTRSKTLPFEPVRFTFEDEEMLRVAGVGGQIGVPAWAIFGVGLGLGALACYVAFRR